MYFESNNVDVFPSSNRTEKPYGKFNSEYNLVNIINSVIDRDSYVISYDASSSLEVVIHGYYFRIKGFDYRNGSWLSIKVENTVKNNDYHMLVSSKDNSIKLDENNYFNGLLQSSAEPTNSDSNYSIYKLKVTDDRGNIINYVRLSSESLYYKNDSTTNLTTKLDSKQDNLSVVSPLTWKDSGDKDTNIKTTSIGLKSYQTAQLASLLNKGNLGDTLIFVDSDGKVQNSKVTKGSDVNEGSKNGKTWKYVRDIYLSNGQIKEARTKYWSTDNPEASEGKEGDMWFKYTN